MQLPQENQGVIYEVNLEADADIAGPFDTWLRDHIADMLQFEGFRSAEILDDPSAPAGRIRRIVHYRLRNQAALDDYLVNHAPQMRMQGVARFGDRVSAERRVLPHREEFVRGKVSTENCLNCGEVLTGQHCSHCGQPAKVRVLSLWGLTKDVIETMRRAVPLWRTDFRLDPVGTQCHTYGISLWLPLSGTGTGTIADYDFRSNMSPLLNCIWDVRTKDADYDLMRRLCEQFRQVADSYLGDYYPLTPYSLEDNCWLGWQFDRPELGQGMVQVFRRSESIYKAADLRLCGLDPEARYYGLRTSTHRMPTSSQADS